MGNTKEKLLLAALSQCMADRDAAASKISLILEHGCFPIDEIVLNLKKEFEKITQAELTMEAIQVYYANHCKLPESKKNFEELEKEVNQALEKADKEINKELEKEGEKSNDSNT